MDNVLIRTPTSIPKAIPILMFPTFAPIAAPSISPKAKIGPLIK